MSYQSPTISVPRKRTDEVDWVTPVRAIIASTYGEDPDAYTDECNALNRCRQDAAKGAGSDATGRDLLYKYFGQLEMLELRFPDVRVPFPWQDAFTMKHISQTSLAYEKASIIFNIAATLSSLASSSPRSVISGPSSEGLKRSYTSFRQAAGMFNYINDNFLHAPSTDMSREVVKCLVGIMIAQASEVFWEKTVEEKKANTLVSRLAAQTGASYTTLSEDVKEWVTKGVFDRQWSSLVQVKSKYFNSVAQYHRALADDAAGLHGHCLVRLTLAEASAKEAQRLASTFASSFVATSHPTLPSDAGPSMLEIAKAHFALVSERKAQAVKDNDLIYHDILPSESTLPPIDKLVAATPIPIQDIYGAPEVQKIIGADLFHRLVPLSVHESASLYSEEKAKLVRAEAEKTDLANTELAAALDYMGLPSSLNKFRSMADGDGGALDSLADPGREVLEWAEEEKRGGGGGSADGLGVGGVPSALDRIEKLKSGAGETFDAISRELEGESRECEQMRVKYGHRWTQEPSAVLTRGFRQELKSHREALGKASSSDANIVALWTTIRPDVEILLGGRDSLEAAFAAAIAGARSSTSASEKRDKRQSLLDLDDADDQQNQKDAEEARVLIKEMDELLGRLHKIKKERADVLKDLKEKIQTDDISHLLILNRRAQNVEPAIFAAELEKFRPHQSRLAATAHHQQATLQEVAAKFKALTESDRARDLQVRWGQAEKARKELIARLRRAKEGHAEVRAGVSRGLQFYTDLNELAQGLQRNVTSFTANRSRERDELVSSVELEQRLSSPAPQVSSPQTPSSPPVPPPPSSMGLESSFANLGLGGGPHSSGSLPPPPPQGQWSKQPSYGSPVPSYLAPTSSPYPQNPSSPPSVPAPQTSAPHQLPPQQAYGASSSALQGRPTSQGQWPPQPSCGSSAPSYPVVPSPYSQGPSSPPQHYPLRPEQLYGGAPSTVPGPSAYYGQHPLPSPSTTSTPALPPKPPQHMPSAPPPPSAFTQQYQLPPQRTPGMAPYGHSSPPAPYEQSHMSPTSTATTPAPLSRPPQNMGSLPPPPTFTQHYQLPPHQTYGAPP